MACRKLQIYIFCFFLGITGFGCRALKMTGKVAKTTGKIGWGAAKITGKAAYHTGKATTKGARTVAYMARGKQVIRLEKQGNSLYATVKLNRKRYAKFLVDTGASQMQISRSMARSLGINMAKAESTLVQTAGGYTYKASIVNLREVSVGRAKVKNVKAIVLDQDNMDMRDGLLGMSFLNHFVFQMDARKRELILQPKI